MKKYEKMYKTTESKIFVEMYWNRDRKNMKLKLVVTRELLIIRCINLISSKSFV